LQVVDLRVGIVVLIVRVKKVEWIVQLEVKIERSKLGMDKTE